MPSLGLYHLQPAFGAEWARDSVGSRHCLTRFLLVSFGICAVAYFSIGGITWSLIVLAVWATTVFLAFRRCGARALWLLLEAPIVLLPFYAIFIWNWK